jgi:hypothetical protein
VCFNKAKTYTLGFYERTFSFHLLQDGNRVVCSPSTLHRSVGEDQLPLQPPWSDDAEVKGKALSLEELGINHQTPGLMIGVERQSENWRANMFRRPMPFFASESNVVEIEIRTLDGTACGWPFVCLFLLHAALDLASWPIRFVTRVGQALG